MRNRTPRVWEVVSIWCAAALAAALPVPPCGAETASGRGDAQASSAAASVERPRTYLAGADTDTLDYSWREVMPAAVAELEKSKWTIQSTDSVERRVVTHWKPMRHVLARAFMGDLQAKVVVDLQALGSDRTVVTIRGGLSSDRDIEGSPILGAAQKTYRGATERWMERVRQRLDDARPAGGRPEVSSL
jgi:hypothetical protein